MIFHVTCKLINIPLDTDDLLVRFGFQRGGPVQCAVDEAFIRVTAKYVPASPDRALETSVWLSTEIGSGIIIYNTPYAHYQNEGIVYGPNIPEIDPETGVLLGFWSIPGKKKHPTDKHLTYDTSQNPLAGAHWPERSKADNLSEILDEARKAIPRR